MNDDESIATFTNDEHVNFQNNSIPETVRQTQHEDPDRNEPNFDFQLTEEEEKPLAGVEKIRISSKERHERARLVARLTRLSKKQNFEFDPDAPLDELRHVNLIATQTGRAQITVGMITRGTLMLAQGLEWASKKFKMPFINLDGYTEALTLQINQYESIMHEIHEYYADQIVKTSPLMTYIMAIGSNMVMYSITNQFLNRSQPKPEVSDEEKKRKAMLEREAQRLSEEKSKMDRQRAVYEQAAQRASTERRQKAVFDKLMSLDPQQRNQIAAHLQTLSGNQLYQFEQRILSLKTPIENKQMNTRQHMMTQTNEMTPVKSTLEPINEVVEDVVSDEENDFKTVNTARETDIVDDASVDNDEDDDDDKISVDLN